MIQEITSLKDEKIQLAKSLNSLKGRQESRKFLIEGTEAIDWALEANIKIDFLLTSRQIDTPDKKYPTLSVYLVSEGLLKKVTDTNYLIPAVAIGNYRQTEVDSDFLVVLDNLKDFGNIGTIIRTCHAFGINSILSTKPDFDLFQRKTVDASRGRVYRTQYRTFSCPEDTLAYLKHKGYQIVTTSPYGDKIQSLINLSSQPVALIVGNETDGASNIFMQSADITVQIPMQGEVESLNVGVATGISIYELKLKQVLGMIEKKIKSTLGREVNVAAMMIREVLDKELKKVSDFSSAQLVFMMVLKCDTIMSIPDAQRQFGIPDKDLSPFLQPLLNNQLITSDNSEQLTITDKGMDTIGKLWTIIENTENKILQTFSELEKTELRRLLDKLKNNCINLLDT